jgi:hypothetical protein
MMLSRITIATTSKRLTSIAMRTLYDAGSVNVSISLPLVGSPSSPLILLFV